MSSERTPRSKAPLASGLPIVRGRCPEGCGRTLFLGHGGYVTCGWSTCPDPGAADTLLHAGKNRGGISPVETPERKHPPGYVRVSVVLSPDTRAQLAAFDPAALPVELRRALQQDTPGGS